MTASALPLPAPTDLAALFDLFAQGDHAAVVRRAQALAALHPGVPVLHTLTGAALAALGQDGPADAAFRRALALAPDDCDANYNYAILLHRTGRAEEAEDAYRRVVAAVPGHAQAWNNLAVLRLAAADPAAALEACHQALTAAPGFADALVTAGNALSALGRPQEALAAYDAALRADPACAEALVNRANTIEDGGDLAAARAGWDAALALDPGNAVALARKLYLEARLCIWDSLPRVAELAPERVPPGQEVHPFGLLSLEDRPDHHRARAERLVAAQCPQAGAPLPARPRAGRRLRLGYFSADFTEHPVAQLIAGVLAAHDRDRFEVLAYAHGGHEGPLRTRIAAAVDRFTDIAAWPDDAALDRVRADLLDVAIDLTGHTRQARTALHARRLAPVQVAHLGYPGTLGAPFVDYLIADRHVIPPAERGHYVERLLVLPHCFQPNDDGRPIAAGPLARATFGLPEQGFVFCCFNAAHKIGPAEWDAWMPLLHAVEGSVLWLSRLNPVAQDMLSRAAATRGVDPARLVFAGHVDLDVHMARHALADLFLDTFAYNAHTTASDALWGGLPVLTLAGRGLAARVGASLLHAVGLADLVTYSPEAYRALALALARDPERLAEIRARLAANRAASPLFATARYTRDLEAALTAAFDRAAAGLAPEDIALPPQA